MIIIYIIIIIIIIISLPISGLQKETLAGIFLPISMPGPWWDLQLSTMHHIPLDGLARIIF